jgi:hypothetical protein
MKIRLAAIAALAALASAGQAAAAEPACDRACLEVFVDRYVDALVAHDPARLPLAEGVKFTENGQTLQLGDGLWGTIEAREAYRLVFADPQAEEVGAFVTVKESGRHQILGLRLKVVDGKISEIETLVVRPKTGVVFGAPEALTDKPIFHRTLTPAQRRSRAELVRIANSYFEGLVQATETLTPFDDDCQRIENGVITANNPDVPTGGFAVWKLGCHAQFATHFSQFITRIRERRFPVVDEERGLVYAEGFFDHAGRMKTQTLADGTVSPVPPDMQVPFTFEIGELFKIQDGKIMRIEALVIPAPYGMKSGWSK